MTSTKLVALLAFYDEDPGDLRRLVASLPVAGVSALVASDGAYAAFPGAQASSAKASHEALQAACDTAGIALHLHVPEDVWHGGEVEKRTHLFALGEAVTDATSWYFVVDSDEEVLEAPADLLGQLAASRVDVGSPLICEHPGNARSTGRMGRFFRAIRGLHVTGNHWTYVTPDGRYVLGGSPWVHAVEPSLPLGVCMVHHAGRPMRRAAARAYYRRRHELGLEETPTRFDDTVGPWPRYVRDEVGNLLDTRAPRYMPAPKRAAA